MNPYDSLVKAAVTFNADGVVINWGRYVDYIDATARMSEWLGGFEAGVNLDAYSIEVECGADCPFYAPWTWEGETFFPGHLDPEDIHAVGVAFGKTCRVDILEVLVDEWGKRFESP